MLQRLVNVLRSQGIHGVLQATWRRAVGYRAPSFAVCRELVAGKAGLEIGGPSPIFAPGHLMPLYPLVGALDNCTYAASTLWQKDLGDGQHFRFSPARSPGVQFIREASDLAGIADERYDFVLSCHALEHLANPLKALREWIRILKPGGSLILIVPHRDGTFDHRRPTTLLEHLGEDLRAGVTEDDLTHLQEIIALHDLSRDPAAGGPAAFAERSRANAKYRGIHHHVFDTRLVADIVAGENLQLLSLEAIAPYHIIAAARKLAPGEAGAHAADALIRASLAASPFASDQRRFGT